MTARVLVAAVAGAFGVRGEIRLKTFTADPASVGAYGPVETEDGARRFAIRLVQKPKGPVVVARFDGIEDRDAAEALKGTRLYVPRAALPALDADDYYLADLIGLTAYDPAGQVLGRISAVVDHGAGDILEVTAPGGPARLFTFTAAVVPVVDIAGGRVVIDPPPEVEAPPGSPRDADGDPDGTDP